MPEWCRNKGKCSRFLENVQIFYLADTTCETSLPQMGHVYDFMTCCRASGTNDRYPKRQKPTSTF